MVDDHHSRRRALYLVRADAIGKQDHLAYRLVLIRENLASLDSCLAVKARLSAAHFGVESGVRRHRQYRLC